MAQKFEDSYPLSVQGGFTTSLPVVLSGTAATLSVGGTLAVTGTSTMTGAVTFTAAPVFSAGATGSYFAASYVGQTTEAATDRQFFVAPIACAIVAISEVHAVAAGGASALQVTKETTTGAPGAGTDILTNNTNSGFDLAATAQTVQVGTFAATSLAVGDRLSIDFAQAIQSTAGLLVTVILKTT
jgi:hypothetical protein